MRIKFNKGQQKRFLQEVLIKVNCPSLRELRKRGFEEISYSALKNYFSERRNLPESLFRYLLRISGIEEEDLHFESVKENHGQIKGGRISRKVK